MPDIDIQESKMGRKVGFISKMLTHRGITHTLLAPALLLLSIWWLKTVGMPLLAVAALGFFVGWTVHIIADMFNSKGVPILWPLTNAHISLASFKTRSWHEFLFMFLWIGGLIACYVIL
jgi:inner membrane protein